MTKRVKNSLFFNIKDSSFSEAEKLITESNSAALNARYKPTDQTTVFLAASRQSGQDEQALALCSMLLERGVPLDHVDELNQSALFYAAREGHAGTIRYLLRKGADPNLLDTNEETAIFYAVSKKREDAVKALFDGGANLEVVNNWKHTCTSEPWFRDLTPAEWCKTVGVITDEKGSAVSAINTVVSGKLPQHFTLPLVETKSKRIAGYVHATCTPEKQEMPIAHIGVDCQHMGQGLGGLLIEAAEDYSQNLGWSCNKTYLSVLKANARAQRCYLKAGFKFESSRAARWDSKEHVGSEWQRWRKVHKHHFDKTGQKIEKQ
eukprot:Skav200827  [mRNA]  locus=scaffold3034:48613:49854:+ [translate_table: standard]